MIEEGFADAKELGLGFHASDVVQKPAAWLGADREKVERTIARALTAGPLGLPNGLSDSAQVKFGDTVLPLIAQVMELREAGDTAQAAAVRADALSKWIAILAAEAN